MRRGSRASVAAGGRAGLFGIRGRQWIGQDVFRAQEDKWGAGWFPGTVRPLSRFQRSLSLVFDPGDAVERSDEQASHPLREDGRVSISSFLDGH